MKLFSSLTFIFLIVLISGCSSNQESPPQDDETCTEMVSFYKDSDEDGYGSAGDYVEACSSPAGYVTNSGDCDDSNKNINPEAVEICDGIDNNCDGTVDNGASVADLGFDSVFSSSPLNIGTGLSAGYEPSGVVWHSRLNKLFIVSDGGLISSMETDGSNVENKEIGGDLEGVTVADPESNFIYLGVEQPRDSILEYNIVSQTVTRTFYLDDYMKSDNANSGLEALAFVPTDLSSEGGYFYSGLQENGSVYIFELPVRSSAVSTNVTFIDSFATHYPSDISDLYYDSVDDVLYAIYDSHNRLVSMSTDGTYISEWVLPLNDQEGFSLDNSCHFYLGEDSGSVWRY